MGVKVKNKKTEQQKQPTSGISKSQSFLDLPKQLVSITERHPNLEKNINFGGIVKSWRTASKQCNLDSKLPWLQLSDPDGANTEKHHRHITWSGSTNPSFTYLPSGCWCRHLFRTMARYPWKDYVGCSNGIFIAEAEPLYMYYLWNPINRELLRLPLWDAKVPVKLAVLSSSPQDQNCTVMVLTGISHPAFAFYKLNRISNTWITPEPQWIMQDCTLTEAQSLGQPGKQQKIMQFTNAVGFKGKFYALSVQGNIAVIQDIDSVPMITDLSATRIVPSVSSNHLREYLLESDGELLLVYLISTKSSVHNVDDVEVYQLNSARLSWLKLESLGKRTLFVGSNCSVSVLASELGCRKNCIYFRHPLADEWWVYGMESGNISPGWSQEDPTTSAIWIQQTEE
ncbi:hypothetical protein VNO77_05179 [Canavalia gladiata]|uniref:KIB1-4 beta-propeller domain-containing protein n=1 Tax=Canavalia gladiata TaxID=3824 RepID=A0AAN9R5E8_CANGL